MVNCAHPSHFEALMALDEAERAAICSSCLAP